MTGGDETHDPDRDQCDTKENPNSHTVSESELFERFQRRAADSSEIDVPFIQDADGGLSQSGLLERERGVLTTADREFLLGQKEFDHAQTYTNTRQRIRERVTNALLDFGLLATHLGDEQRERVFEEMGTAELAWSLRRTVSFLYAGLNRDEAEFAELLADGVFFAEMLTEADDSWLTGEIRDVDVSIAFERAPDADELYDRYQSGEPLTDGEIGALVRSGRLSGSDLELLSDYPAYANQAMFTPGLRKLLDERAETGSERRSDEGEFGVVAEVDEEADTDSS